MFKKTPLVAVILFLVFFFGHLNFSNAQSRKKDKKKKKESSVKKDSNSDDLTQDMIKLQEMELRAENAKSKIYQASNTKTNDIIHTKLEVKFDWQNSQMFGKATITIKPYFYPQTILYLNARGMDIYKVQLVQGVQMIDLVYKYQNDSLTIQLNKEYKKEETYVVFIDYKSKPEELQTGGSSAITSDKGLYFINPKGEEPAKMPQIWTQGETQSNSAWFPTVDSPNEKMTDEIYITVENKYTTLSNGLLKDQKNNVDGTRVDHWVMDLPHAPYLVMMAIGEFKIVKDTWKGKDVWYYVEKEYEQYAKAIFGNTPEMIEFFSNKLGVQFAWQKYSQIVCRDYVSGAMENTSATLHGDFLYSTERELLDGDQEDVISHELFHQWFGDLVTCESWSNLPLNESFATYGEYLWNEYKYGLDDADAGIQADLTAYLAESEQKINNLIRFNYKQREDMFDAHSYQKGGRVLHMLRKYVGDDAFFASLKLYLERNKFQTSEIHNLRLCFEETTGQDLNWFFNQWFLSIGHPQLKIETNYDAVLKKVIVKTTQQQDFNRIPIFKLPLKIDIYFAGKKRTEAICISEAVQIFEFDGLEAEPELVNFDAEKSLLCEKSEPSKTIDQYIFQYKNAPLYLDRLEALEFFRTVSLDSKIYDLLKIAINDKYKGLRKQAIKQLGEDLEVKDQELKNLIIKSANSDKDATVRTAALRFLNTNFKSADLTSVYLAAMNDMSYEAIASALIGLSKVDSVAALNKARQFENENSNSLLFAVMDVYSSFGDDKNNQFFVTSESKFIGFDAIGYYNFYNIFLKKCKIETTVVAAEFIRDKMKFNTNKYVKFYASKLIKDQASRVQKLIEQLTTEIRDDKNTAAATQQLNLDLIKMKEIKIKLDQYYIDTNK